MPTAYYKLARPDGWDFRTGNTINYREAIGGKVKVPNSRGKAILCSDSVLHASRDPLDALRWAKIPCSAYLVNGRPVVTDSQKSGFRSLQVIEEITDLDSLFGFKYNEAINPFNPFSFPKREPTNGDIKNLKDWASVRASVGASVRASVGASVRASVWAYVWASVRASVWAYVWASVRASVWDSVRAYVWAYIGSFFPAVKKWRYVDYETGTYPFQPAVDLWYRGFVPLFNGKTWQLFSGPKAEVVYEWTP